MVLYQLPFALSQFFFPPRFSRSILAVKSAPIVHHRLITKNRKKMIGGCGRVLLCKPYCWVIDFLLACLLASVPLLLKKHRTSGSNCSLTSCFLWMDHFFDTYYIRALLLSEAHLLPCRFGSHTLPRTAWKGATAGAPDTHHHGMVSELCWEWSD